MNFTGKIDTIWIGILDRPAYVERRGKDNMNNRVPMRLAFIIASNWTVRLINVSARFVYM